MTNDLLIIFTRNPELGKVKTRLAAKIGVLPALKIYKFLLQHTFSITKYLKITKQVHYTEKVRKNDIWDSNIYVKKQQFGKNLGERMQYAFQQGFRDGFKNIVIIGSDMYDLSQQDIEKAFIALNNHNFVIGPAEDGGYYLLGIKQLKPEIFQNKEWGSSNVLDSTLKDLKNESLIKLPIRNDVDHYEDIKDITVFQKFINNKEKTSL